MLVSFSATKLSSIHHQTRHSNKPIQGAGLALLVGWSAFTIAWGGDSTGTILSLLVLNACVGVMVFSNLGRLRQLPAANLAWLSSASVAMNLLDSWAYAALFPDLKGVVLAATPGVIAFAIWLVNFAFADHPANPKWSALSLFWLIVGETLWLGMANFQDEKTLFFGALLLLLFTLILSKRCFQYGFLGAQIVNTAILLLAVLPIADVFVRFHLSPSVPENGTSSITQPPRDGRIINAQNAHFFYSYDEAHGDPGAFATFYSHFRMELDSELAPGCYAPMPGNNPPYRLRPNGQGRFFDSVISINSRGFRGAEIAATKGNVYRIVCLGESTVFGMTMQKDDKPWPELLEQMINERLKPTRPVEVVNAGVPGWSIESNLKRLRSDILPLRPDLVISYHGYNGFAMIDDSLPPVWGPPPPPYPKRPLRLAAELEYRMDLRTFARQFRPSGPLRPANPPLQTPYADCYRQLIAFSHTNHIRLALANYCMAIDENSGQKLISFYNEFGAGVLYARARVNVAHTGIVRRLAQQNPGVLYIDTHPGLDGDHRKFIDVVHFTQEGRHILAENVFAGLRPQLEQDLARSTNPP